MKLFAEIQKFDEDERLVMGYASTEALDMQGEIVSIDAIKAALPDYLKFANIREMHQPKAAGTAQNALVDEKGLYLVAKVEDDLAWKKVKTGVYKGFSIGGRALERVGNVIKRLILTEISLVDRPANPEAIFDVYKADITDQNSLNKVAESDDVNTIDKDGSPSADMNKGMYQVAELSQILSLLDSLKYQCAVEAQMEGDNSPLPGKLKTAVENLGEILKEMVTEEVNEINQDEEIEMSEKTQDLAKFTESLSKIDALSEKFEKLLDVTTKMADKNEELSKRLEAIEQQPEEIKGVANAFGVITKAMDVNVSSVKAEHDELETQIENEKDPFEKAVLAVKQLHLNEPVPALFARRSPLTR